MLDQYSDLHLCTTDPARSVVFPGPAPINQAFLSAVNSIIRTCETFNKNDFMIQHKNSFYRGRRDLMTVDGTWYRLRKMPATPPTLDSLPTPVNRAIKGMLTSPYLRKGGLVYIVGAPGSGKTTTASATVVSRLNEHGGVAYTIEDPPEMPLNGWHGKGYCSQTWVSGDTSADWQESFRAALRSQPVGTLLIMFVGEVRDTLSARAMLRASANGFLVIATGFGSDTLTGLESLARLASGESGHDQSVLDSISSMPLLVVHQRIVQETLQSSFLVSPSSKSPGAAKIRNGGFIHLGTDAQFQTNQAVIANDADLFNILR
jgi:twitching motility protein PilT